MDRTNETEEAASEWLMRRESGHWTPADQAHLEQWLEASALNRVAFLRLELAWEDSARLKALGAGIPGEEPPPPGQWNVTPFFDPNRVESPATGPAPARAPRRIRRFAIAASVVLAIAVSFGVYYLKDGGTGRYLTPVGGLASVPMSDGSKITLNTNSQVRVALTQTERHVDLKQGEAFFEVARDPSRPFVVEAGRKRIVAVGTKFSVRRDGDSVEVVVTEGKVRVEDVAPEDPRAPVFLTPGAIARADESGVLVQRKTLPEAETRLSWRAGVLMFREQSLADAVAEFNRYNARQIVIADPAVAALKVEGNFRANNIDAFVRLLESGFPVRATAREDQIVLSSR